MLKKYFHEVTLIYFTLLKIMIPTLLIVKVIEQLGLIDYLALAFTPLMFLVGLPAEMGLVFVTGLSTNIYTAMVVFYELNGIEILTIAQVSVLGGMILICHGLPVEAAITKASGVSLTFIVALRVLGAFIFGFIMHHFYSVFNLLQEPINVIWQPAVIDNNWLTWLIAQAKMLIGVFFIIATLVALIRLLRYLKIEKLIHLAIAPLLKLIGVSKAAANTIIIGLTLGLAFGGGLLIQEAKSGAISGKDIVIAMCFLSLCHSIIEDSLLIMLMGADLSAVLWGRLLFTLIAILLLVKVINLLPEKQFHRLYQKPS